MRYLTVLISMAIVMAGCTTKSDETTFPDVKVSELECEPVPDEPDLVTCDPPEMPIVTEISPVGPANENSPVLTGTGQVGTLIRAWDNEICGGTPLGESDVSASGAFTITLTVDDDWTTEVYANAMAPDTQVSPCTEEPLEYVEDSTAPDPPILDASSPTSPGNGPPEVQLSGRAEAGATLMFYEQSVCGIQSAITAVAEDGTGNFVKTLSVAENTRTVMTSNAVDVAGNLSQCSFPFEYIHDNIIPLAPTIAPPPQGTDGHAMSLDLTVSGEVDTVLQVYDSDNCFGGVAHEETIPSIGSVSVNVPTVANTTVAYTAMVRDAATNASSCSNVVEYHNDSLPPQFAGITSLTIPQMGKIEVKWSPATDSHTPQEALQYEVCLSVTPGGCKNPVGGETYFDMEPGAQGAAFQSGSPDVRFGVVVRVEDAAGNSTSSEEKSLRMWDEGTVTGVAVGGRAACALQGDGKLSCWGDDNKGQVSSAAGATVVAPQVLADLPSIRSVSAGAEHVCSIDFQGKVHCWGDDSAGQLASATDFSNGLVQVSAGGRHSCGVTPSRDVVCWGANAWGQLGRGDTAATDEIGTVAGLPGVVSVSAGSRHSCAVAAAGTVWCWGANDGGQLGDGTTDDRSAPVQVSGLTDATHVATGGDPDDTTTGHSCARRVDGSVYCWGYSGSGQAGPDAESQQTTPLKVISSTLFRRIAAGADFSCALAAHGQVFCWGATGDSQVSGGVTNSDNLVEVSGLADSTEIDAGGQTACVRTGAGQAWCWGRGVEGQLGDGKGQTSSSPTRVVNLVGVAYGVGVETGGATSCVLRANGKVMCWGQNGDKQAGYSASGIVGYPVLPVNLPATRQVAMGRHHACALTSDGNVKCWGDHTNYNGGNAGHLPATVSGIANVEGLCANKSYTYAHLVSGAVIAWEHDDESATVATYLHGAKKLVCGYKFQCALLANGQVRCRGDNVMTQLGSGSGGTGSKVVPLSGKAVDVVARSSGACALLDSGAVYCWGSNGTGSLGTPLLCSMQGFGPKRIGSGLAVYGLGSGTGRNCLILNDGSVQCIGDGNAICHKQDNGKVMTLSTVGNLEGVVRVSGSNQVTVTGHLCFQDAHGLVQCMGSNYYGATGLGATQGITEKPLPVLWLP